MAFGRPFIEEIGLVYNREEGTVKFKQNDEKITFKMPHTMEIFKQTRLMGLSTDSIPSSAYEENFSHGRTHYYQSLLIGDEYMQDGGDRRGIRHLITGFDEAIRQAYLVGMDTESEPFEDPVETEAPELPHNVAPLTSLPDNTTPTSVPILRRTVRMAVRVSHPENFKSIF
ncbi:hypothetical protein Tco_0542964 [Tanacetum coccineum]